MARCDNSLISQRGLFLTLTNIFSMISQLNVKLFWINISILFYLFLSSISIDFQAGFTEFSIVITYK